MGEVVYRTETRSDQECNRKNTANGKEIEDAIDKIDRDMVEKWVRDLVVVKTFMGLRFQEAILKKAAEIIGADFKLSDFEEESKGIDGYIGNILVPIKPDTYKVKAALAEDITVKIIYYKKIKNGIEVNYGEIVGYSV
jgi:hypothetical protein